MKKLGGGIHMKRIYIAIVLLLCTSQHELLISTCQNKPLFISLGSWCVPAIIMRDFGLRHAAYPFDWNTSSFEDFYNLLKNDFHDFMLKENLYWQAPSTIVLDRGSGISFHHDFAILGAGNHQIDPNYLTIEGKGGYKDIKAKYDRRIKRFRETLSSSNPIIFIRADAAGNKTQTIRLRDLIAMQYPNLNFLIIQLGCTNEYREPWNLDRILNFYIDKRALDPVNYNAPDIINLIKFIENLTGCTIDEYKALNKPNKEE